MSKLAEKLRKAREKLVDVGEYRFTIRRPTDVEASQLSGAVKVAELIPFIVGWDKVKELDLIPGGGPEAVPFDPVDCREWLSDRPDLLAPLVDAIVDSYKSHIAELEELKKN